jgi:hypothetical protein
MLYREIIAVCSEIHTKHMNTLCGQNVELLDVKPRGTYSNRWNLKDSNTVSVKKTAPNCNACKFWRKTGKTSWFYPSPPPPRLHTPCASTSKFLCRRAVRSVAAVAAVSECCCSGYSEWVLLQWLQWVSVAAVATVSECCCSGYSEWVLLQWLQWLKRRADVMLLEP